MSQAIVQAESLSFAPSTLLSLFQLDGTNIGLQEIFYFYDGTSANFKPVVFNGITYTPLPIIMEDSSMNGQGQLSRPKLSVSNVNGFISAILLYNQSLVGAKLTRTRVYARFIDNVNFQRNKNPYGTPDPTAAYPDDIWYINRKLTENQQIVQFELASLFEVDGVKLPKRIVTATICGWKYRDPNTCSYSGPPVADKANKLFSGGSGTYGFTLIDRGLYGTSPTYNVGDYVYLYSTLPQYAGIKFVYVCNASGVTGGQNSPTANPSLWIPDACPRNIAACKLHFPTPLALRGGFFPGVALAPFIVSR